MLSDPLVVVARLVDVFNGLGIRYVVGGSLASSLYGIPRATLDADLLAEITASHVESIVKALENEFYVASELVLEAIQRRSSFNVIHLETMFKADIFIAPDENWPQEETARARTETIELADTSITVRFSSPEDTILHKLVWYKLGGHISDQQWGDVIGVIKIQGESLDMAYLDRRARSLNLEDLLARARVEGAG